MKSKHFSKTFNKSDLSFSSCNVGEWKLSLAASAFLNNLGDLADSQTNCSSVSVDHATPIEKHKIVTA